MSEYLSVRDLSVHFPVGSSGVLRRRHHVLRAVAGVDLDVPRGSIAGVVGESGCGKSTLARAIVGLQPATEGTVSFDGEILQDKRTKDQRRRIQMIFQDPSSALNPRMTVEAALSELLRVHRLVPANKLRERCAELLDMVELPSTMLTATPRRLSGGQRQRIGIARALAVEPDLLIADESVAALDVSVQAAVLNLLMRLKEQLGLTMVFISHDLGVIRHICDSVAVMYLGRVVAVGTAEDLFADVRHPYARALIAAVPEVDADKKPGHARLPGEPPSPLNLPDGCRFHPRCAFATNLCSEEDPQLRPVAGQLAACHRAEELPQLRSEADQ